MEITEKVAYLKGLAEGLSLDAETKEGKIIAAMIDILDDIALELEDLGDGLEEVCDGLDAVSEDLEEVEDIVYDEFGEDDFEDEDEDEEEEECYATTCPNCEETVFFDEDVLNGAMLFILVSCVASSFITEHTSRRMAQSSAQAVSEEASPLGEDRILLALSNPETVVPLVNAALVLRTPGSNIPLTALNVVLEDNPHLREEGMKQLERAVGIASAANVRMITRSRWSVNVVSGISHTLKEFNASDLLLGLHQKSRLTDTFYGKLSTDLLASTERQVIIYRAQIPINTVRRIHILVPRRAEFEQGFHHWADRLALLAEQLSCPVELYGGRGTLAELQAYWDSRRYSITAYQHVYTEWHDFISIAHQTHQGHMIVFIAARRGTLSRHKYMDHLPEQIERYFSARSVMIIFPTQVASILQRPTVVLPSGR